LIRTPTASSIASLVGRHGGRVISPMPCNSPP
jgi:hypothetical protein